MEQHSAAGAVLRFGGPLTVSTAESTKNALLAALSGGSVVIDCSEAAEIDLSFVQLVLAARRSAALRGHAISLAAPASGDLLDLLVRAGLLPSTGEAPGGAAFWTEGASS